MNHPDFAAMPSLAAAIDHQIPGTPAYQRRTGICLNMIVKDEVPVIERLLHSVQPVIDYFVIVDTGSEDGTLDLIQRLAVDLGLPGEVHSRAWVNFGVNRQQAMELAIQANRGDWLLFLDADEELVCPEPEVFTRLEPGLSYLVERHHGMGRYALPALIDVRHNRWKWRAPVHEYLECLTGEGKQRLLTRVWILYHAGESGRSRGLTQREKYLRDAALLEEALRDNPADARNRFYLAQSYRDAGELERAYEHYDLRASMAGWDQETHVAQREKGRLAILLGKDYQVVLTELLKAYALRPTRAEPLWLLASYCRALSLFVEGYRIALLGVRLPPTQDILFVDKAVQDWRIYEEFAYCALAVGRHGEAAEALRRLLQQGQVPANDKNRFQDLLTVAERAESAQRLVRQQLDQILQTQPVTSNLNPTGGPR